MKLDKKINLCLIFSSITNLVFIILIYLKLNLIFNSIITTSILLISQIILIIYSISLINRSEIRVEQKKSIKFFIIFEVLKFILMLFFLKYL